jgi:hypothetical protein
MARKRPLHPCARTTRALRRRIQLSEDSDRALAGKMHVNVKTVAKWRKRNSADDAPMGPRRLGSTSLNCAQEALAVVVRKVSRMSLDRELSALRRLAPDLSRSALYRCLRKWGVARIPRRLRAAKPRPAAQTAPPPGARLRIFLHHYLEADGRRFYLLTCLNEAGDWLHACAPSDLDARTGLGFLRELLNEANFAVGSIVTPPHFAFCIPDAPEATWHAFQTVCRQRGVVSLVDVSLPSEPAPVVAGWKDVD